MKRLVLYTSDLQIITGKGEKACRRQIAKVKQHFGKSSHQLVTIKEYCTFTGISVDDVYKSIGN